MSIDNIEKNVEDSVKDLGSNQENVETSISLLKTDENNPTTKNSASDILKNKNRIIILIVTSSLFVILIIVSLVIFRSTNKPNSYNEYNQISSDKNEFDNKKDATNQSNSISESDKTV